MTAVLREDLRKYLARIEKGMVRGPMGLKGDTGSRGPQGPAGQPLRFGVGAPTGTALENDTYLDVDTGDLYQYGTAWELQLNIKGPQGIPGAALFTFPAGEDISAARAVSLTTGTQELVYSDPTTALGRNPLGISVTAALSGDDVQVVVDGEVQDDSWSFTVGQAVLLGYNGSITQTQPNGQLYMVVLGTAVASDTILVRIQRPILLAQ